MGGLWLDQGLGYLSVFQRSYGIAWFLPLLILAPCGPGAWIARLFLSVLCSYLLYVLYVGGDRFEFRFPGSPECSGAGGGTHPTGDP